MSGVQNTAAGIDGIPSNVFHHLTFDHYLQLADTFSEILNTPWDPCYSRPSGWDHSSVSLLPKVAKCTQLQDFRPIALISQSQKIWERLLADQIEPNMQGTFGDFQYGFRKGRQCAEVVATLLRIKELALQWNVGYVLFRVDIRKAFDMIKHSSVIAMLMRQGVDMQVTYAIAREITHLPTHQDVWACSGHAHENVSGHKARFPLEWHTLRCNGGRKASALTRKVEASGPGNLDRYPPPQPIIVC